jgi:MFS transporter
MSAVLPASHRGRVLAAGALIDAMATGLYLAAATLYFVGFVGIPARSVGVALGLANVCGLLVPMPAARLTRTLGVARVYIALLVLRGLGMAAYALAQGYWRYLLVTCFFTAASRAALPLLQVLVGRLAGEDDRTATMASLRTINNIGLSAGFVLAGGVQLLHSGFAYRMLFVAGGLAFLAVSLVTAAACRGMAARPAPAAGRPRRRGTVYTDGRFLTVAAANAVLLLHDSMLFILIPLWVIQRCGLPPAVSSGLLVLNTVLTVVLQVRVARYAKGARGAMRVLRWAVVALAAASLFLGPAGRGETWLVLILLACAVMLLTVGENLQAVASWELSFLLSPPQRRPQYLSLFSLGYTGQLIVGPVLMTSVVLPSGLAGLLLMTALFALAASLTWLAVRGYPAGQVGAVPQGTQEEVRA